MVPSYVTVVTIPGNEKARYGIHRPLRFISHGTTFAHKLKILNKSKFSTRKKKLTTLTLGTVNWKWWVIWNAHLPSAIIGICFDLRPRWHQYLCQGRLRWDRAIHVICAWLSLSARVTAELSTVMQERHYTSFSGGILYSSARITALPPEENVEWCCACILDDPGLTTSHLWLLKHYS